MLNGLRREKVVDGIECLFQIMYWIVKVLVICKLPRAIGWTAPSNVVENEQ